MLKIGVTGGIGSGKSTVCKVFSILGAPVYNSDLAARRIMDENMHVRHKLNEAFGPAVFRGDVLDRKALADIVFNDPDLLNQLNEIVHPAVRADFMLWLGKHGHVPYIIKEAAIMFEAGMHRGLDTVILVTAPEKLRLHRIMLRDGESEESVRQRMASQWPDSKKYPLAGMVINNDNREAVLPVILKLHSQFLRGCLPEATDTG